jgi:hypothetical protein
MPYFVATGGNNGNAAYGGNSTIVLSTEHLDRGGGYNTSNGIYTCPIKGLYYFHMALYNNGRLAVAFAKNGSNENNQVYEGADVAPLMFSNSNASTQWGISIMIEMDANDTMRIKNRNNDNTNSLYRGHSMFMGYCIVAR